MLNTATRPLLVPVTSGLSAGEYAGVDLHEPVVGYIAEDVGEGVGEGGGSLDGGEVDFDDVVSELRSAGSEVHQ